MQRDAKSVLREMRPLRQSVGKMGGQTMKKTILGIVTTLALATPAAFAAAGARLSQLHLLVTEGNAIEVLSKSFDTILIDGEAGLEHRKAVGRRQRRAVVGPDLAVGFRRSRRATIAWSNQSPTRFCRNSPNPPASSVRISPGSWRFVAPAWCSRRGEPTGNVFIGLPRKHRGSAAPPAIRALHGRKGQKPQPRRVAAFSNQEPGGVLLSHGETPHYHRR